MAPSYSHLRTGRNLLMATLKPLIEMGFTLNNILECWFELLDAPYDEQAARCLFGTSNLFAVAEPKYMLGGVKFDLTTLGGMTSGPGRRRIAGVRHTIVINFPCFVLQSIYNHSKL